MSAAEADRAHAVSTGSPEIQLLACVLCGVILWDIDAHYSHAHKPADPVQDVAGSLESSGIDSSSVDHNEQEQR